MTTDKCLFEKSQCQKSFEIFMRNTYKENDFSTKEGAEPDIYVNDFTYCMYLAYWSAWRTAKGRIKRGKKL